jgi:transcriptional regulator with XRE-family HTH domain
MEVANMKLGDVLRKERERKRLTIEEAAERVGLSVDIYKKLEGGDSPIEEVGPMLAKIAIKLSTPTSRLISETGKSAQAGQTEGQCGQLVKMHRERRGLDLDELAKRLEWSPEQLICLEKGESPLEQYAPLLLRFAEMINQPIFNLFYPCGLPFADLKDYP